MGRAPCCEKKGLKKGPWIPAEDHILVSYIQQYGPGDWRNLPKEAGLLRCGKSCRLRWTNYLRPDIKRGNFTSEEEEAILKLHQMIGNRWSAIAATLPGRTDNEIKNYWRTHLKKRLLNGTDATDAAQINGHQGDMTVEYHSLGEQPSNCTVIPNKESKSESRSNVSINSTDAVQINGYQGGKTVEYHSLGGEQLSNSTVVPKKESESESRSNVSINATDAVQINGHQGDKTVEYYSLSKQLSNWTAIPKVESESESRYNVSMGLEGHKEGGNALDRKDSDSPNEDFWAEVLSETCFSMEVDGGFEVQSTLSSLLPPPPPPMYDVTSISQAWGRENEDNLDDFGGTSLRSFGNFNNH